MRNQPTGSNGVWRLVFGDHIAWAADMGEVHQPKPSSLQQQRLETALEQSRGFAWQSWLSCRSIRQDDIHHMPDSVWTWKHLLFSLIVNKHVDDLIESLPWPLWSLSRSPIREAVTSFWFSTGIPPPVLYSLAAHRARLILLELNSHDGWICSTLPSLVIWLLFDHTWTNKCHTWPNYYHQKE